MAYKYKINDAVVFSWCKGWEDSLGSIGVIVKINRKSKCPYRVKWIIVKGGMKRYPKGFNFARRHLTKLTEIER